MSKYIRPHPSRPQKKKIILATEGTKDEPEYLDLLRKWFTHCHFVWKKNSDTAPKKICNRLKQLKIEHPDGDNFWGIFDTEGKPACEIEAYHTLFDQENFKTGISN